MITWSKGRQGTGYFKKLIFCSKFFEVDCYILKYPKGSYIPFHKDIIRNRNHHRINIVLPFKYRGGEFVTRERFHQLYSNKKFCYFRPDLVSHAVNVVKYGTRYVLSIGWTTKKD